MLFRNIYLGIYNRLYFYIFSFSWMVFTYAITIDKVIFSV